MIDYLNNLKTNWKKVELNRMISIGDRKIQFKYDTIKLQEELNSLLNIVILTGCDSGVTYWPDSTYLYIAPPNSSNIVLKFIHTESTKSNFKFKSLAISEISHSMKYSKKIEVEKEIDIIEQLYKIALKL